MQDKNTSTKVKTCQHQKKRYFQILAGSIFLFHSELCTLTTTLSDSIDGLHLHQVIYAMGIVYPRVFSNSNYTNLLKRTMEQDNRKTSTIMDWSSMLLDSKVPARRVLAEAIKPSKNKRGRQKTTWISKTQQEIHDLGLNITLNNEIMQQLSDVCRNRDGYRNIFLEFGVTHDVTFLMMMYFRHYVQVVFVWC